MTRISDYAANNALVNYLMDSRRRVGDYQTQVATREKAQQYVGISSDAQSLVNYETARDLMERYKIDNEMVDMRLQTAEAVTDGIRKTIMDFRNLLYEYESGSLTDEQRVKNIQDAAFRALNDMEVHLNAEVDGRFLFAGSRTTTLPVDLDLSLISAFQAKYDGDSVLYPPTRDAHVLSNKTVSDTLTFTDNAATPDTITAGTAGAFTGIAVGSTITVSGSATHDGDYTVVSNTGTVIEISGSFTAGATTLTANGEFTTADEAVAATLTAASYYTGDTATQTHRVDDDRDISIDLNAIDPAFDKAIRAMSIIAQGQYGTDGGLDNHSERIDQALYLLSSSLDLAVPGTPPFGTEETNNLSQIERDLGYHRTLIADTNERHKELSSIFDQRASALENADPLEAIAALLDLSQALEASYQAVARVRQLTLSNYL